MWKKIKPYLKKLPYFGVAEVKQLSGLGEAGVRQNLSRWVKQGKVIRLKRNVYILKEWWLEHKQSVEFEDLVASLIWPKGYVSTEFVLDRFGILSEPVKVVTGVTLGNGGIRTNIAGKFVFRHLKRELWGGFEEKLVNGIRVRKAKLGKALFDWLYLRRLGSWFWRKKDYNLEEDLRLNLEGVKVEDKEIFEKWVEKSNSFKMKMLLESLRRRGW